MRSAPEGGSSMIRGIEQPYAGLVQLSPPPRGRRRATALGFIIAVALAGGLIGQLAAHRDDAHPIPPGPFSYFPT